MAQISVVVPVYKVEAYLDRCVRSILNQSFSDFELVLVDDGSPDRCGQLCDGYAARDSRIHVIHQENGGLSAARNSGIDWVFGNSESQWIAFVDSDDWVHREFLSQLYRAVSETGCAISACGLYRTGGENRDGEAEYACRAMSADDYYCSPVIHGGVTAVAWNKLYHRSLFETLRYPGGKLHEDEFTTYQAVYAAGRVAVVEAELYAYYQNPQGIMNSAWNPRRLHALEAVEQQMAFARKNGNSRLLCKAAEQYVYSVHGHLEKIGEKAEYGQYRKDLRKKMRQVLPEAKKLGLFPFERRFYWAYEDAYPCRVFWWLMSKVR